MKAKKALFTTLIGISLLSTLTACTKQDKQVNSTKVVQKAKKTSSKSTNDHSVKITDQDVIGTWINHKDKDIHQKIVFHKNHTWNEDQHGTKNIYHGTWKITGNRKINLKPYDEDIVFTKGNFKRMTVVSYNHVLTKNN